MEYINESSTDGITLENIELLPNLHHEHYHECVDRQIKEGLEWRKRNILKKITKPI